MDTVFTLSENYTISLPEELLKRLGSPYELVGNGFKDFFLFLTKEGERIYIIIHSSISINKLPGYHHLPNIATITKIKNGEVSIPKSFLPELEPGTKLLLEELNIPIWLEVL